MTINKRDLKKIILQLNSATMSGLHLKKAIAALELGQSYNSTIKQINQSGYTYDKKSKSFVLNKNKPQNPIDQEMVKKMKKIQLKRIENFEILSSEKINFNVSLSKNNIVTLDKVVSLFGSSLSIDRSTLVDLAVLEFIENYKI